MKEMTYRCKGNSFLSQKMISVGILKSLKHVPEVLSGAW